MGIGTGTGTAIANGPVRACARCTFLQAQVLVRLVAAGVQLHRTNTERDRDGASQPAISRFGSLGLALHPPESAGRRRASLIP